MKILKFILPAVLAFSMAGCLDVEEKVEVKKDGSGTFAMDMDMSQMVEMLQTYMGKDEMAKKGMQKMDTTIYMKNLVDTMSSMSADKKALLSPGSVHIKLDADAKVFTTHMSFPYKSQADLQKLYSAMSDGSLGTTQLFKGMTPGEAAATDSPAPSPDINQFNNIYDFTARDGLMSKRLNADKFKTLQADPQMAQIKQASQMGIEINYTTTIQLPRPVKKVDNTLAKLSEDKRTVTIKYNLMDVFDHPEKFNYTIEY